MIETTMAVSLLDDPRIKECLHRISSQYASLSAHDIEHYKKEMTKSSTVLTGLRFLGGVIAGSDGQSTAGYTVQSLQVEKLYEIDTHSVIGLTGVSACCVKIARIIKEIIRFDSTILDFSETQLSTERVIGMLQRLVEENMVALIQLGLIVLPLLMTVHKKTGEGMVVIYDTAGMATEKNEGYASLGCGSPIADGVFITNEHIIKRGLSEEEAIRMTVHALAKTCEKNQGCGGKLQVKIITPSGIRTLSQAEIGQICGTIGPEILPEYGSRYPYENEPEKRSKS